jgi:hypothetical protein
MAPTATRSLGDAEQLSGFDLVAFARFITIQNTPEFDHEHTLVGLPSTASRTSREASITGHIVCYRQAGGRAIDREQRIKQRGARRLSDLGENRMRKWRLAAFAAGAWSALAWLPPDAVAGKCLSSYTIGLTVELSPELTNRDDNILVELRQGVVGQSKIADIKHFAGHNGSVVFLNICAGSYFIDIGNGSKVAVGPVHVFGDDQHIQTTVRVTYSNGNVGTMNRSGL